MEVLDEAVSISEEVIHDFFPLSTRDWIENPYEVRTLREVGQGEHPGPCFAHLVLYGRDPAVKSHGRDARHLYRICLNDTKFIRAGSYKGGVGVGLLPLFVYVITHELVHIVRFGRFVCSPLADERLEEEMRVHDLTRDMLLPVSVPGLGKVIGMFTPASEVLFLSHRHPYSSRYTSGRSCHACL